MWIEADKGLFVNLNQVCTIKKSSTGSSYWYEFRLSNGEAVKSYIFGSQEKAESWFEDEIMPFLIQERRESLVREKVR